MAITLTNYHIRSDNAYDKYRAPESCGIHAKGIVNGHPKHPDGSAVATATITSAKGREMTTASGRVYVLGEPDPAWVEWMAKEGIPFDAENPIRVVKS